MIYSPRDEELIKKYPHFERIVDERFMLNTKILNLETFINGDSFKKILEEERELLLKQFNSMKEYLEILDERIEFYRNKK